MIRRHFKKFSKLLAGAVLGGQVGMLAAGPFDRQPLGTPKLHTTISADGKMVATLLNAGTNEQLLRIRKLDTDTTWRTVQVPSLTQDIRFGVQGHELLVSYYRPDSKTNVLGRLDLAKPGSPVKTIYEGVDLGFPVEVSPGRVIVRTHHPANPKTGRVNAFSYFWLLLEEGKSPVRVGPEKILGSAAPSIVGSGFFFWLNDLESNAAKEAHPHFRTFPLPGGQAPKFEDGQFDEGTWDYLCDHAGKRCLRHHITNYRQIPAVSFIYDIEVLIGSERCKLPGVAGWHDDISITPDGNSAVTSLASGYDKPRHVVVMRFNPQQCEAISVQHINFEEK